MNLTTRLALPEDWTIIRRLNQEVFDAEKDHDQYLNLSWPKTDEATEYYKKVTSDNTYYCSIAFDSDVPVGYLAGCEKKLRYRSVKTAEIDNMGVSPNYRSKGIGSLLIKEFKQWAAVQGFQTVLVTAYFRNPRAHEFYKKQGLEPFDISFEGTIEE